MPTTSNFGWTTPADTDLVKDGAAAIRTLGNGIDASLVDLKGGTTNQILAKNSNTDLDFKWVADQGMTNPLTTTGDVIYSSSGSTPARLGIGTTGQILTVSGGLPVWSTPAPAVPANAVATGAGNGTTSTTYVNLTSSVAVTLTTGTKALVIVRSQINTNAGGRHGLISYEISGASTVAASDDFCYSSGGISSTLNGASGTTARIVSGLTAGSNTFTVKVRSVDGGTVDFNNVQLSIIDMGS